TRPRAIPPPRRRRAVSPSGPSHSAAPAAARRSTARPEPFCWPGGVPFRCLAACPRSRRLLLVPQHTTVIRDGIPAQLRTATMSHCCGPDRYGVTSLRLGLWRGCCRGSLLRLIKNSSPARRDGLRFPCACRVLADRARAGAPANRPRRRTALAGRPLGRTYFRAQRSRRQESNWRRRPCRSGLTRWLLRLRLRQAVALILYVDGDLGQRS